MAPPDAAPVRVERDGPVGIVTLDRPEVRNAIDNATAAAVEAALDVLEADAACAAVVLTGSGDRAFSAGLDLKAFAAGEADRVATPRGGLAGVVERDLSKPLIAAVNGAALAGGMEIVLACDLVVAEAHATFGLPEVRRGLIAAAGGLLRLPQRVPRAVALELVLTGAPITAERAAALGLVNAVVPAPARAAAVELGRRIAANSPAAVRASLRLARDAAERSEWRDWELNRATSAAVHATGDALEGAEAFVAKREPRWRSTW